MKRFITRGIHMTRGVHFAVEREEYSMLELRGMLDKHFINRGEECKEDNQLNEEAIKYKEGRVFSVFTIRGQKFYVTTEGLHLANDPVYGKDYPVTTIMFADEY